MDRIALLCRVVIPVALLLATAGQAKPVLNFGGGFVLKPSGTFVQITRSNRIDASPRDHFNLAKRDHSRPAPLIVQDRASLLIAARTPKTTRFGQDWGDHEISVRLLRTKSLRDPYEIRALTHNRFALWSADMAFDQNLGTRDTISFAASYDLQRRRPAYYLGAGNIYRTVTQSAAVHLTHDQRLRIGIGLFETRARTSRSALERSVELAGGAPRAVHGTALIASFSPTGDPESFSVGLDLRQQRHSALDARLFGITPGRSEARATIGIRRSF
jgi:hypothetical protein